ncbi:MAG: hypothetical protein ABIL58_23275 [Pseudomonadota bacterium]
MAQIIELDYLLGRSPHEVVRIYEDTDAMEQRILEWLDTPEGSVADRPEWGHPLHAFKHEPNSDSLRVMAEMMIFEKLSADVVGIDIRSVSVEFSEIDMMVVSITHGTGFLDKRVAL